MGWLILALGWGLAEATLFFIIPDVLLTFLALQSGKKAIQACLWALLGALIGGTIMYAWGSLQPQAAIEIVEKVPAINQEMVDTVKTHVQSDGLLAMLLGPTQGIPYKIYAVTAAQESITFFHFFLVSIPARFIRFVLTTALAWAISKYLLPTGSMRTKIWMLASAWLMIYLVYFLMNPS